MGETPDELSDDLGLQGTLAELMRDAEQRGWWIALIIGLFGTAYAGLGAVRSPDRPRRRGGSGPPPARRRGRRGSSSWSCWRRLAFATYLRERSGSSAGSSRWRGSGCSIALRVSEVLPHRDVPRRALVPGAVLVALGVQGLHLHGGYLAGSADRATSVYGAIGAALVILLWLFIFARLIIGGAVLNAELAARRERSRRAPPPAS